MNIAAAIALALLPPLIMLWIVRRRDVFPEPAGVVWMTYVLGMVIVLPILVVAAPVMVVAGITITNPYVLGFIMASLGAGIPEEFFKFLVVRFYAARHPAFNEPMDGMVYGVAASLGFATLENVIYTITFNFSLFVVVMRALTAIPMHGMLGAVMGYYIAQWRFRRTGRGTYLLLALLVPMILHSAYDFPMLTLGAMQGKNYEPTQPEGIALLGSLLIPLGVLIGLFVFVVVVNQRLRASQLRHAALGGEEGKRLDGTPLG
jgi:RsiW-degrading membrane proteinase PrsW (M82 family)